MKIKTFILTIYLGASCGVYGVPTRYTFAVPENIKTDFNNIGMYSFVWTDLAGIAQFIMFPLPEVETLNELEMKADSIGQNFKDDVVKKNKLQVETSVRKKIQCGTFLGSELGFTLKSETGSSVEQHIFLLWDGTQAWWGQLTGSSKDDLDVVYRILESADKVVDTSVKDVVGKSYSFTILDSIKFKTMGDGLELYSFRWGTPPNFGMFILHAYAVPATEATLKRMADMMETTYEEQMKETDGIKLVSKDRKSIALGVFKGTEIAFEQEGQAGRKLTQSVFILFDGDEAWKGTFTGTGTNDLEIVYSILKNAKKTEKGKGTRPVNG